MTLARLLASADEALSPLAASLVTAEPEDGDAHGVVPRSLACLDLTGFLNFSVAFNNPSIVPQTNKHTHKKKNFVVQAACAQYFPLLEIGEFAFAKANFAFVFFFFLRTKKRKGGKKKKKTVFGNERKNFTHTQTRNTLHTRFTLLSLTPTQTNPSSSSSKVVRWKQRTSRRRWDRR